MTDSMLVRVGIGSRLRLDGEVVDVVGLHDTHVVLRDGSGRVSSMVLIDLLGDRQRAQLLDDRAGPAGEPAAIGLSLASEPVLEHASSRAAHVREVLTGYRSGHAELALPGEPRPEYAPDVAVMRRYAYKAAETGIAESTVRKWVRKYQEGGEAALLQKPTRQGPFANVDSRWLDTARVVLDELTDSSTVSRKLVLQQIAARLERDHGPGTVGLPRRTLSYHLLRELSRGRNTFTGSAKGRREIAARPQGVYGRLRATRPGEYLVLDTTPLDVFAMEPVTLRWVGAQLTVAMDLYSRCIVGLRLTPVSAKAVDVASVIYQALRPAPAPDSWPAHASWPYPGWPSSIVVDADSIDGPMALVSPQLRPDTIISDHGRIYVSEHVTSACARVGISIQPARLYRATDKPVERFFRTLRQGLLEALPGYKGPDVFSRGKNVEKQAFFFLNELEDVCREWTAAVYHHRPHDGLADPHILGLPLTPAQMFAHGIARAGYVMAPPDPDLVYEFLHVVWRHIHHYGVDIGGLRYQDRTGVAAAYANRDSGYRGKANGRWPFHLDPDDVSRVFFRDPATGAWHTLWWEHQPMLGTPFSADALAFAKSLALENDRFPDTAKALSELLQRWRVGLADTPTERRIALRAATTQAALPLPRDDTRNVASEGVITKGPCVPADDDDEPEEKPSKVDPGSFYAEAWQALS